MQSRRPFHSEFSRTLNSSCNQSPSCHKSRPVWPRMIPIADFVLLLSEGNSNKHSL